MRDLRVRRVGLVGTLFALDLELFVAPTLLLGNFGIEADLFLFDFLDDAHSELGLVEGA
jgi:hypothetical protein